MDKENCKNCKKEKDRLNSLYGMTDQERERQTSYERLQIAEEHLSEVITKEVDNCPDSYVKIGVLMSALDSALDNLEIDKPAFIEAWSRGTVKDDVDTAGAILKKFSENGITTITGLVAGLSCILDKTFDRDLIKIVIKLMNRYYNE